MEFTRSRNSQLRIGLEGAVLQGLAADGGLFVPVQLPSLDKEFMHRLRPLDFCDVALHVARELFGGGIPAAALEAIIHDAFSFPLPLVSLAERVHVLELFHGPTLAFKDFGARFQSRLLAHIRSSATRPLYILVATSGDTGSAVANGFYQVHGIEVIILYPSKMISSRQESQIATLGGNIHALEVNGTFDDCQRLLKTALADGQVRGWLPLTTANSINVARLLPQSFYYFYAWTRLPEDGEGVVFSVPCGNFGNLTAGLLAKRMGLPVDLFLACTNANDVVPEYLERGEFRPRPALQTISNAMDVGNPSNFERLLHFYGGSWKKMKEEILGSHFSDEETREAIHSSHRESGYVLDPHSAVALAGLKRYLEKNPRAVRGISLGTAHPAKFPELLEPLLGISLELPESLRKAEERPKRSTALSCRYSDFKDFLYSCR